MATATRLRRALTCLARSDAELAQGACRSQAVCLIPVCSGYSGTGSTECNDIHECQSHNGGCDPLTTCTNLPGSFSCGNCPSGYTGTGLGGCIDINECLSSHGGCAAVANCTNTPGNFFCGPSCPKYYTGDPYKSCTRMLVPLKWFDLVCFQPSTCA